MSKEFEVNGVQYMAVEVPRDATDFEIGSMDQHVEVKWLFYKAPLGPLPKIGRSRRIGYGTWQIVGKVGELTWEQKCFIYPYYQESVNEFKKCLHIHEGINLNDNSLIIKKI